MQNYSFINIAIYTVIVVGFAGFTILLSALVGPKIKTEEKLSPYECGVQPIGNARYSFPIKYYIIALMFLVFDVEVIFMYPWAIIARSLGAFGMYEMGVFILVVLVGFVYAWKKGAFEWE
jgi:NADH-quinone oxidoreductase subunit A